MKIEDGRLQNFRKITTVLRMLFIYVFLFCIEKLQMKLIYIYACDIMVTCMLFSTIFLACMSLYLQLSILYLPIPLLPFLQELYCSLSYGRYAQFLCVITKLLGFGNWIFKVFPPPQYSEIPSVKVRLIMRQKSRLS